ncbi:SRPBCC family protein [Amaricoccus tamworthensis]|uniref:SRPBCC family protein n=1 Tax=Amaricoccus tamworthensis TaxID=57002 RepID=UPI003C7CC040
MELDPKTDLTFTRTLPVPRDVVWDCWTSPEHIPHFFVPRPHRVTGCEIDLQVGGRFNTVFEVDGREMRNTGVYLDIIEGRRLVFTDAFMEGWKPAPEPFMTVMLDLSDAPEGGTVYTVTARHRSEEARATHEDMGFFAGWGTVADQLVEYAHTR